MIPRLPSYIFVDDSSIKKVKMNNIVRSEMESGIQKTRRKQSRSMFQVSFNISICDDKESSFYNWFENDLNDGANWFIMKDPLSGEEKRFRFIEYEIAWNKIGDVLQTSFKLESY